MKTYHEFSRFGLNYEAIQFWPIQSTTERDNISALQAMMKGQQLVYSYMGTARGASYQFLINIIYPDSVLFQSDRNLAIESNLKKLLKLLVTHEFITEETSKNLILTWKSLPTQPVFKEFQSRVGTKCPLRNEIANVFNFVAMQNEKKQGETDLFNNLINIAKSGKITQKDRFPLEDVNWASELKFVDSNNNSPIDYAFQSKNISFLRAIFMAWFVYMDSEKTFGLERAIVHAILKFVKQGITLQPSHSVTQILRKFCQEKNFPPTFCRKPPPAADISEEFIVTYIRLASAYMSCFSLVKAALEPSEGTVVDMNSDEIFWHPIKHMVKLSPTSCLPTPLGSMLMDDTIAFHKTITATITFLIATEFKSPKYFDLIPALFEKFPTEALLLEFPDTGLKPDVATVSNSEAKLGEPFNTIFGERFIREHVNQNTWTLHEVPNMRPFLQLEKFIPKGGEQWFIRKLTQHDYVMNQDYVITDVGEEKSMLRIYKIPGLINEIEPHENDDEPTFATKGNSV